MYILLRREARWTARHARGPPTSGPTSSSRSPGDSSPRSTSPPSSASPRTSSGTCLARSHLRKNFRKLSLLLHLRQDRAILFVGTIMFPFFRKSQSRWPLPSWCPVTPPSSPRRRSWDSGTRCEWSRWPRSTTSGREGRGASLSTATRTKSMCLITPTLSPAAGDVIWCDTCCASDVAEK